MNIGLWRGSLAEAELYCEAAKPSAESSFPFVDKGMRILIVDDFAPWRQSVRSILEKRAGLQIVGEASDGEEALQKTQDLRPDLILLDIGLPNLNGIEASAQIRQAVPDTVIIFVTQTNDAELARAALSDGAMGYVLKVDAEKELWLAIEAAFQGKQFVSSGLRRSFFSESHFPSSRNSASLSVRVVSSRADFPPDP
jgi:DNA-binding NarL/FixJ family response regulator